MLLPYGKGVLSVKELVLRIKQLLDDAFPFVAVCGEVSNLRIQSSGHAYFTLKDAFSQISVVLFKGDLARQKEKLLEGKSFIVEGHLDVYLPRGSYQIIARNIQSAGLGYWQQRLEVLKQALAAEGFFDKARKRAFPPAPKRVGVITSKEGAALKDFLSILKRKNWKGHLILFPALVQGEGAVDSLLTALQRADQAALDLLVVTRGGGSIEDLWCFNEERLIRALAAYSKPVLSGVGHEIDYTLCDFVADFRAETPTAAAEWIANNYLDWQNRLMELHRRLKRHAEAFLVKEQHRLLVFKEKLQGVQPKRHLETFNLRLDDAYMRLRRYYQLNYSKKFKQFFILKTHLKALPLRKHVLGLKKVNQFMLERLKRLFEGTLLDLKKRLGIAQKRLQALSVESHLARGFSMVLSDNDRPLNDLTSVELGQVVTLVHRYGQLKTRVVEKNQAQDKD